MTNKAYEFIYSKWHQHCSVYTDGSKAEKTGSVGAAFCIPEIGVQKTKSISNFVVIMTGGLVGIM